MNTADKIGLLPGFGWIADLSFVGASPLGRFLSTLLVCWLITPVLFIVIGRIFEDRWVPLGPHDQFWSFFPGDLFLGLMAVGLLRVARSLPEDSRWYNSFDWHLLVLVATVTVACVLTYFEWKGGAYPAQAILSPTKLYHNGVLYALYGYVIVTTLVALVADHSSWVFLWALIPGILWGALVAYDNTYPPEVAAHKAASAHTADWRPIWSRHW